MLTIDLSDEQIITMFEQLPEARRERLLNHFVVARNPYPEEGEWTIESVPGDERMDAETFAAVREGIEQIQSGQGYSLEEADDRVAASLAEWARTRGRKV
ncbi:MAG: hypothetical protein H7145_01405 [Akkermansiaceae bacterium]|nr:hypothetical protein [Armatimonadota bacterium]